MFDHLAAQLNLTVSGRLKSPERLFPQVYEQLHQLARLWFSEQPQGHTLQPTALINEAYLRMAHKREGRWQSRTHFYAIAARAMRQVLVDHARRRAATKRGGAWCRIALEDVNEDAIGHDVDIMVLNDALDRLAQLNERQCRIVELRFLAGLSVEETAEALAISPRTVKLDWRMARAWLLAELR